MPVYKDEKRNTWFCKCNYKDWLGESKSKMKRGFATKKMRSSGNVIFYRNRVQAWI